MPPEIYAEEVANGRLYFEWSHCELILQLGNDFITSIEAVNPSATHSSKDKIRSWALKDRGSSRIARERPRAWAQRRSGLVRGGRRLAQESVRSVTLYRLCRHMSSTTPFFCSFLLYCLQLRGLTFHDEAPFLALFINGSIQSSNAVNLTDDLREGPYTVTTKDNINALRLAIETDKKSDRQCRFGQAKASI
ncbi:hypothetical protein EVAR_37854_1 [Eumeta japonica]|uniref:Uncharacterized protein n=1 Tax=Eumeta variegata TaxID=151549 RepID=A0A4C1X4K0_EUMVA|nr:hypothetical protein EVAR_37854_1 [Eumeta japonica]